MPNPATPLSAALAELRTATMAAPTHGRAINYVIKMIYATLARLFTELEQLFLAWQSGQLETASPRTRPSRTPRRRTARPSHAIQARIRPAGIAPTSRALTPASGERPCRRHSARDPP